MRLKHAASLNINTLREDTDPGRLLKYVDIGTVGTGRLIGEPEAMTFGEAPSRARRLVREGDTIISTVRTYLRAVWPVGADCEDLVVSTGFSVVSPGPLLDARFLGWWAQSNALTDQLLARSVGVSYPAVRPQDLADVRVPAMTLGEQARIADFLDAETARIDALIARKRRMIGLIDERRLRQLQDAMEASQWPQMRLRHVVERFIDTEHATVPTTPDGDYVVVRTPNVRFGKPLLEAALRTDLDGYRRWTRRAVPRPGDVLLTREAPAGEACVVPDDVPMCIGQRMVLLKVRHNLIHSEWLAQSIYAERASVFIDLHGRTSTVAHLNMRDIPDIPLLVPPLREQQTILTRLARDERRNVGIVQRLDRQIELLTEHRQALITAAVTGQIPIPA